MNLQTKVALILFCALVTSTVAFIGVQTFLTIPTFDALEVKHAERNVTRCREAIQREIDHLAESAEEWSISPVVTGFLENGKTQDGQDFLRGILKRQAGQGFVIVTDAEGKVICKSLAPGTSTVLLSGLIDGDRIRDRHSLYQQFNNQKGVGEEAQSGSRRGIIQTRIGPLMVAVVKFTSPGGRIGLFTVGHLITGEQMDKVMEQMHLFMEVLGLSSPRIGKHELQRMIASSDPNNVTIETHSDKENIGQMLLRDMAGRPAAVLRVFMPREIHDYGVTAGRWGSLALMCVGVGVLLVVGFSLRRLVIRPVMSLTQHAASIARSGDLEPVQMPPRKDEVGVLCNEFNRMVDGLSESQRELVKASHRAGMAEVSRGVIHNVGNVLNSAMVGVTLAKDRLGELRLEGLDGVTRLLQTNKDDIGRFLSADERGRRIPEYLQNWAQHAHRKNVEIEDELNSIRTSLVHAVDIIEAQQQMARAKGVNQKILLHELVERSVTMVHPSMVRHGIRVSQECASFPAVMLDEQALGQAIVNLLMNAKDAIIKQDSLDRHIHVTLSGESEGTVVISVADNGVGISEENLARVFGLGFTTREDGNGLGLHISANSINEMAGTLSVASDGPGKGATFTIRFPGLLAGSGVNA